MSENNMNTTNTSENGLNVPNNLHINIPSELRRRINLLQIEGNNIQSQVFEFQGENQEENEATQTPLSDTTNDETIVEPVNNDEEEYEEDVVTTPVNERRRVFIPPAPRIVRRPNRRMAQRNILNLDTNDDMEINQSYLESRNNLEDVMKKNEIKESEEDVKDNAVSYTCAICRDTIEAKNMVRTPCNHEFCNVCFFKWLSKNVTCALCRNKFTSWDNLNRNDIRDEIVYAQRDLERLTDRFEKYKKEDLSVSKITKTKLIYIQIKNYY